MPCGGSKLENEMHYLIHKPFGYLSQFVCEWLRKKLLGELYDFPQGTMAIAAVGFPVLRLIRVRIGNIHLNDLQPGEVKQVETFDL